MPREALPLWVRGRDREADDQRGSRKREPLGRLRTAMWRLSPAEKRAGRADHVPPPRNFGGPVGLLAGGVVTRRARFARGRGGLGSLGS